MAGLFSSIFTAEKSSSVDVVQPSLPLAPLPCESKVASGAKESVSTSVLSSSKVQVSPLITMKLNSSLSALGSVTMRFSSPLNGGNFTAGAYNALLAWDPTGLSDFSVMAGLFTEYSVSKLQLYATVQPASTSFNVVGATGGYTSFAYVADDPTSVITATIPTLAQMDGRTSCPVMGGTFVHSAKPAKALAAITAPTPGGGWLRVTQAWPGRFLIAVLAANGSSTDPAAVFYALWTIKFRVRAA
jgi:hypothetical protein